MNANELRSETRHIRERLEKEKTRGRRADAVDIKFGAGGMLDVYFAVRYLQLRDDISDEGDDARHAPRWIGSPLPDRWKLETMRLSATATNCFAQ